MFLNPSFVIYWLGNWTSYLNVFLVFLFIKWRLFYLFLRVVARIKGEIEITCCPFLRTAQ